MIRAKPRRLALYRTGLRAGVAVLLGGAALLATQAWVATRSAAAVRAAGETAAVLVTARALLPGSRITAADLRWQAWPAEGVAPGWTRQRDGGALPYVGRTVTAPLPAGVPITAAALATAPGGSLAAAIRPGWRATTIAVTPAAGLAGFVTPGDRVDVLLTQALGNRRTAQLLVADLAVLGVDQRRQGGSPMEVANDVIAGARDAEPPGLITLEVTPAQAQAIAVATEMGRLSLVLRGPMDRGAPAGRRWDSDVTGLSVAQLAPATGAPAIAAAAIAPVPAAPAPAPASGGVEIIYGAAPAGAAK